MRETVARRKGPVKVYESVLLFVCSETEWEQPLCLSPIMGDGTNRF